MTEDTMYPTRTTSATGTFRVPPVAGPAPVAAPAPVPVPASAPVPAPVPAPVWGVAAPREAVPVPASLPVSVSGETSTGWATVPAVLLAAVPEVPAARAQAEPEPVQAGLDIPHPQDEAAHAGVATLRLRITDAEAAAPPPELPEPEPEPEPEVEIAAEAEAAHSGVPGPGVAEIVAQAVARGLEKEHEDAPQDIPVPPVPPLRGAAVTELPVHLPFLGEPKRMPAPAAAPARSAPAPRPAVAPRPAPGRRVPRGDDRLREHRGPVLPGWIGVGIGGLALAGCTAVLWRAGAVPATIVAAFGATPRAYQGLRATHWPPLAFLGIVALLALGGLGRSRTGHAWVLTLFGRYRGTVRRTGLTWISPLLLRRRVDVRLRHWRSEPMPAVDSGGLALQVVVQVVWQVKDTARAALAVADHVEYLAEQVESAMARVLSQLPADAFHEDAPTLRDAEAVGDALTRMLAAETEAVGIEVFSAQPTRIEYAAEVAEAMRRRRVAAIDAKHRDTVLTSVVDAVDDTVHRLTSRGLVELDDYERKALVKDLTVAFYTGRCE
ncbi:SPFH domain-containing protein [Streptomyces sp. NBC_00555]|uniref:SPFH domain-containing protein n=1 Tax=Streptomyces sp. NBC_00555 TaxID=2903662 RepID=UPI002252316B|nr:SPFH domain-containing protein [Streptomyces sp. NBC_00555]MCX5013772.1 SPFH domain-containing protein [Streptomyces sp. NBC_00555]